MTAPRMLLLVVGGGYLAAGVAFNVTFPLGEGPDEPAHFAYVQYVARERALPVLVPVYGDNDTVEAYQAPLYYVAGAMLTFPWMDSDPEIDYAPPTVAAGKQPHFHHSPRAAFPWTGGTLAWHLLRFFSLGLGAITLWAVHRTALHCFDSEELAVAATACLALNPQFVYIHSLVSNDSLATLAGSLLVLFLVRTARGPGRFQPFMAGLLLALAALSKASVLLLAAGLGYLLWRRREDLIGTWRQTFQSLARLAAAPALLAGWWFARNLWLYGDLTGTSMSMQVVPENHYPVPLGIGEFLSVLPELVQATFRSWWAGFGWMGFELPRRVFNGVAIVHLVVWGRLLLAARWERLRSNTFAVLLLSAGSLLAGFCYYNTFTNHAGWQGRLLFPAASIAALAFVAGWRRFFAGRNGWAAAVLVTAQATLLLYVYFGIVLPAFG